MIRFILNLYIFVLIIDAILSFFPQMRNQQFVVYLRQAADVTCRPIRKLLPPDLPFDFSPIVVILAIQLIKALW
jgi:YggT family protein